MVLLNNIIGGKEIKWWKTNTGSNSDGSSCFSMIDGKRILARNRTPVTTLLCHQQKVSPDVLYSGSDHGIINVISSSSHHKEWDSKKEIQQHTKCVNDMILSWPTEGRCDKHSVLDHRCYFYSVSDDRRIIQYDTETQEVVDCIFPPCVNGATIQKICLSDRHIFVGNSRGIIFVYPIHNICERGDIHSCKTAHGKKRIRSCVQNELKHGDSFITSLRAGGKQNNMTHLFSASYDGSVAVFQLKPKDIDFPLKKIIHKVRKSPTYLSVVSKIL